MLKSIMAYGHLQEEPSLYIKLLSVVAVVVIIAIAWKLWMRMKGGVRVAPKGDSTFVANLRFGRNVFGSVRTVHRTPNTQMR